MLLFSFSSFPNTYQNIYCSSTTIYSVFNCSPYVENYGGRVASVIAFGGKYRLRFRAACLTGRVPYIGRPSCGAAVYGVCQLNRMPMPAYMV